MTAGKWRRLLVPAFTTLLMLVLACGLGVWQLERLAWKTRLLADVDRAEASPAIPLPTHPPAFAKVRVEGKWLTGYALYGADLGETPSGPRMGGRLIMALQPASGPPILVDRGWVPAERALDVMTPVGAVAVEGYIRQPEHAGLFAPQDDSKQHRFYTLEPAAIGASLGLRQAAPFVLVSLGPVVAGVYPVPAQALPRPPNDHLSYAITWFGLALTLMVIFLIYSRKVLRA
jgi:surfeit locus 1 family protein